MATDDYIANFRKYDKGGACSAYVFDYTTLHSLEEIASTTYESRLTCSTYEMTQGVYEKLKSLEE